MLKKIFVVSAIIFAGLHSSTYAYNAYKQVNNSELVQVKEILEKAQEKNVTSQEIKVLLQELLVHEQPENLMAFLSPDLLVLVVAVVGAAFLVGVSYKHPGALSRVLDEFVVDGKQ